MTALLKLKAQILVDGEIALGPGKADLLDAIAAQGSISAAGRALGLSYRRAWLMVDAMNRLFAEPLVQTSRGGPGGAALTAEGRAVLALYRQLEQSLRVGAEGTATDLLRRLKAPG
jgi:molybdate transport system regulatory protein